MKIDKITNEEKWASVIRVPEAMLKDFRLSMRPSLFILFLHIVHAANTEYELDKVRRGQICRTVSEMQYDWRIRDIKVGAGIHYLERMGLVSLSKDLAKGRRSCIVITVCDFEKYYPDYKPEEVKPPHEPSVTREEVTAQLDALAFAAAVEKDNAETAKERG